MLIGAEGDSLCNHAPFFVEDFTDSILYPDSQNHHWPYEKCLLLYPEFPGIKENETSFKSSPSYKGQELSKRFMLWVFPVGYIQTEKQNVR